MNYNFNSAIMNRIICKDIKPRIRNSDRIIRRKYLKTLPEEIRDKIDNYVRENKIVELGCWFNSHLLSLNLDVIDVVKGWYGIKLEKSVFENLKREYGTKERFRKFDEGDSVVDMEKGIWYTKHSWNKYKDYHFCLTTELDSEYKGKFVFLNEQEVISGKALTCNPITKKDYYSICIDHIETFSKRGYRVVNESLLKSETINHQ